MQRISGFGCSVAIWLFDIYLGEILLDPERRQFELEINSKPPAAFHVPPGGNKSVEFLQNLQPHSLAEERQRNLSEK